MLVINEKIKRTAHCKRIKTEGRAARRKQIPAASVSKPTIGRRRRTSSITHHVTCDCQAVAPKTTVCFLLFFQVPRDFVTAPIDPLRHHWALTNDFGLMIRSGLCNLQKFTPLICHSRLSTGRRRSEQHCERDSLLKCKVSVFHNRMLSQSSSLALWLTLGDAGTRFSFKVQDHFLLSLLLILLLLLLFVN